MLTERTGLIVWVNDLKPAKNLERFGTIHYISKKMHYVVLYIHAAKLEETLKHMQRLPYVKKVEPSYRNEIKTEYSSNVPDKTRFYSL
ncbi:MAG: YlbG family protein [Paenibacillaceae bacterium]|uniref:YlbG family protein n=1 Tax=Paenibacillus cymbidii TaxID=1639034 RepID=UPI001081C464|nr:YlbG family protein [Paenibacillus cymbidii]MBO9609110.1 YlbG family protein [Paenibacillaceae bacterium]